MVQFTKKRAKRILYLLRKKVNCKLYELSLEEGHDGQRKAMEILRRLIKKGLVNVAEHPHGNNLYYLTEEGKRIADEIVYDGQNWIKVCVGGETNSQIQGYLERIQSFCDQNDIGYEKLCIYTCIEGPNQAKQLELTSKFCQDIEKVKRGI